MASEPDWDAILGSTAKENGAKATPVVRSEAEVPISIPVSTEEEELRKKDMSCFPEHATGKRHHNRWYETAAGFATANMRKIKCENNVKKVLRDNVPVKLLTSAMKSVGCPFDVSRHCLCEHCNETPGTAVAGGFDPVNHQIVVCQNTATTVGKVTSVLAHELIHAFDYCRSTFDFNNIDHVACSEVRASALTHCSFLSAFFQGSASPFNFKDQHQSCVKMKATESVMGARNVSLDVALESVQRVFPTCYRDLEPFGRIPRRNSRDLDKAYYERIYYGYGS